MTIKDIAKRANCAVGTVSRALNGHPGVSAETRERIMRVVAETGFKPNDNARHLKQRGGRDIAIIVKGVGNLLFARLLEATQSHIKANHRAAAVYYLDEDDDEVEQAVRVCRELKPVGILFLGGNRENFLRGFSQVRCPCVLISTRADAWGFDNLSSVSTDDVAGGKQAMLQLLEAGHHRVGVIGGQDCMPVQVLGENTSQLRLEGCVRACAQRQVPFDPAGQTVESRYSLEGGYEATKTLLDNRKDTTAIFAMCDVMAIGAMRAIRERGLQVPRDVSVVGFDGIELSEYCDPKLTTIQQDGDKMAKRGVEILLQCIEKNTPAVHEIVPFRVINGESVRKL